MPSSSAPALLALSWGNAGWTAAGTGGCFKARLERRLSTQSVPCCDHDSRGGGGWRQTLGLELMGHRLLLFFSQRPENGSALLVGEAHAWERKAFCPCSPSSEDTEKEGEEVKESTPPASFQMQKTPPWVATELPSAKSLGSALLGLCASSPPATGLGAGLHLQMGRNHHRHPTSGGLSVQNGRAQGTSGWTPCPSTPLAAVPPQRPAWIKPFFWAAAPLAAPFLLAGDRTEARAARPRTPASCTLGCCLLPDPTHPVGNKARGILHRRMATSLPIWPDGVVGRGRSGPGWQRQVLPGPPDIGCQLWEVLPQQLMTPAQFSGGRGSRTDSLATDGPGMTQWHSEACACCVFPPLGERGGSRKGSRW